jgi:hypothetical protein
VDAGTIGQLIVAAGSEAVKVGTTLALQIEESEAAGAVSLELGSDQYRKVEDRCDDIQRFTNKSRRAKADGHYAFAIDAVRAQ